MTSSPSRCAIGQDAPIDVRRDGRRITLTIKPNAASHRSRQHEIPCCVRVVGFSFEQPSPQRRAAEAAKDLHNPQVMEAAWQQPRGSSISLRTAAWQSPPMPTDGSTVSSAAWCESARDPTRSWVIGPARDTSTHRIRLACSCRHAGQIPDPRSRRPRSRGAATVDRSRPASCTIDP